MQMIQHAAEMIIRPSEAQHTMACALLCTSELQVRLLDRADSKPCLPFALVMLGTQISLVIAIIFISSDGCISDKVPSCIQKTRTANVCGINVVRGYRSNETWQAFDNLTPVPPLRNTVTVDGRYAVNFGI